MDALVDDLIRTSRLMAPEEVPQGVAQAGTRLGATDVVIWLADYEQRALHSFNGDVALIEGTVLGRCFSSDDDVVIDEEAGVRLLMPLIDGAERLGVLEVQLPTIDDALRRRCGRFTALVAELVVSRSQYSDAFFRRRRGRQMSLEAEMQWHLLVPLTFSIPALALSAMVEPAYEVGGDAFDYAHDNGILHVALFDAMGHGVQASLTSALAVGTYRHARRQEMTLLETYDEIDRAIGRHRPEAFSTAILAQLESATGELRWVAAGHPAPMLLRDGAVNALTCAASMPAGVAAQFPSPPPAEECTVGLQPGDRVLFYSDGCVEAATPSGEPFGEERLADFLIREQSAGLGLGETVRRLSHAFVDHAAGGIKDDATVALVEYRGSSTDD
jgi:hypothetical protein